MNPRVRLFVLAGLTALSTFGVPAQAHAEFIPRTLGDTVRVAPVIHGSFERTVVLPWRANSVGFSFSDRSASGFTLQVRAHTAEGWGQWSGLGATDVGPDAGVTDKRASSRTITDPMWVGSADALGIKMTASRPLHDLRIHVVNTLGDARPATLFERVGRGLRSFFTMQPAMQPADAKTSMPAIISRAKWGAKESWRRGSPDYASQLKMVFVHHTDNSNSYSRSQSAAIVRSIYHYHVFTNGWNDIGYNFLVDRYGQIFEGRYGGTTRPVIGAHTMAFNTYSTGISMIGNFSTARPTSALLKSLAYLTAWKMDVHHIPPTGKVTMVSNGNPKYSRGTAVSMNRISGHRNAYPTACPGSAGYGRLPWLRSAVLNLGNPKIYLPSVTSTVLRNDGDGVLDGIRWRASFSGTVRWSLAVRNRARSVSRSFTGSGTSMSVGWRGDTAAGSLLPTGRYSWELTARDSGGHIARPVTGTLSIVTTHPEGTLLSNGGARYRVFGGGPQDLDALHVSSNFGENIPTVATGPAEKARYTPVASPATLRQGTILRNVSVSPATYYIWDGQQLRQFGNATDPDGNTVSSFDYLGYSASAAIGVTADVLATILPAGPAVTNLTVHPTGTIIRKSTGAGYVVSAGGALRPIGALARRSLYRLAEIVDATPTEEALVAAGAAMAPRDGTLVTGPGGIRWILVPSQGSRRQFLDPSMYAAMGYSTSYLLGASQADLDAFAPNVGAVIG